MKRGYLSVGDNQVHFTQAGTAGPKIVLLHESPLSNRVFDKVLPVLGTSSQVFAPDTPGYGNSDPINRDASMDQYAKLLGNAIKQWSNGESVVVLGVHTGASLAIEIANQFPELCRGLFLIGVPVYTEAERADRIANWCPDIKVTEDGNHLSWAWQRYVDIWPTAPLLDRNTAVIEMLSVWDRYNWGYLQAFKYEVKARLKLVQCPIMVAAAEGEFLYAGSKSLAAEFELPFTTFAGLDGQVPMRNPELFANTLKDFCNQLN